MCLCSNRAAAYLALGMWEEALKDAERARVLAQDALKKTYKAAPLFIKSFAQKGTALIGEGHQCLQPSTFFVAPRVVQSAPFRLPSKSRDRALRG